MYTCIFNMWPNKVLQKDINEKLQIVQQSWTEGQ